MHRTTHITYNLDQNGVDSAIQFPYILIIKYTIRIWNICHEYSSQLQCHLLLLKSCMNSKQKEENFCLKKMFALDEENCHQLQATSTTSHFILANTMFYRTLKIKLLGFP